MRMTNPTRGAHSLLRIAAAAVCASAVLTACSTASAVAPPTTISNVVLAAVLDSAPVSYTHLTLPTKRIV